MFQEQGGKKKKLESTTVLMNAKQMHLTLSLGSATTLLELSAVKWVVIQGDI